MRNLKVTPCKWLWVDICTKSWSWCMCVKYPTQCTHLCLIFYSRFFLSVHHTLNLWWQLHVVYKWHYFAKLHQIYAFSYPSGKRCTALVVLSAIQDSPWIILSMLLLQHHFMHILATEIESKLTDSTQQVKTKSPANWHTGIMHLESIFTPHFHIIMPKSDRYIGKQQSYKMNYTRPMRWRKGFEEFVVAGSCIVPWSERWQLSPC